MKISIIAFSKEGYELAEKLKDKFDNLCKPNEQSVDIFRCIPGGLKSWTEEHFNTDDAIVFTGAVGIAVRAISDYVNHKAADPAIIVMDEAGKYVIPILSGHIGHANELALRIADLTGAEPVITTATDIHGKWAVDTWAVGNGMTIVNPEMIKDISSAVLEDRIIGMNGDVRLIGALPDRVKADEKCNNEVYITYRKTKIYEIKDKLILIPKCITVGIGCRKGCDRYKIEMLFDRLAEEYDIDERAIKVVASIDIKAEEEGILEFADDHGFGFVTYSAEELDSIQGDFSSSDYVKEVTGVDNVCERSAALAAGDDYRMIVGKTAEDGVTMAFALGPVVLK
ncbi:MAG: cobalt-precorrin 5A hydrolase [Lachnospiraceae bacterium]|nr:cobalt-precorrin 5A hydrolase [Lachnospiraceae bacterium]